MRTKNGINTGNRQKSILSKTKSTSVNMSSDSSLSKRQESCSKKDRYRNSSKSPPKYVSQAVATTTRKSKTKKSSHENSASKHSDDHYVRCSHRKRHCEKHSKRSSLVASAPTVFTSPVKRSRRTAGASTHSSKPVKTGPRNDKVPQWRLSSNGRFRKTQVSAPVSALAGKSRSEIVPRRQVRFAARNEVFVF